MTVARKLVIALVTLMVAGGFAMIGGAADIVVFDQDVAVDSESDSIWIEVDNNGSSLANMTAEVTGYDSNDTDVSGQTETVDVNTSAGASTIHETTLALDGANVSYYNVQVTLDNTSVAESDVNVTSGTFQMTDGGGGVTDDTSSSSFLDNYSDTQLGIGAAIIILLGYFGLKED